jgi:hypothetical protein
MGGRDFFLGRVREVAVSLIVGIVKMGGIDETSRQLVGRSYAQFGADGRVT